MPLHKFIFFTHNVFPYMGDSKKPSLLALQQASKVETQI
jgi:hypothetical protein